MAIVNGFGNIGSLYVRWCCVKPSCIYVARIYRISAYTWKAEWGPAYHPSMIIGIFGLALATVLAYGTPRPFSSLRHPSRFLTRLLVIRYILIQENKRFEREEQEMASSTGARRQRIEDAARLEGITFEEALRRKRGFRYLI